MIEETAEDYSTYANVEIPDQIKNVQEAIDEMQTRLEEFGSLIGTIQIEGAKCSSEYALLFRSLRSQLVNLCNRIDNLERFIDRINADIVTLESDIDVAEIDLGVPLRRFAMLSFFKKAPETTQLPRNNATYQPPVLSNTNDFFESS